MKWIKIEGEGYYDGYRCSDCNAVIVVSDDCELPCYCKNCESEVEDDD